MMIISNRNASVQLLEFFPVSSDNPNIMMYNFLSVVYNTASDVDLSQAYFYNHDVHWILKINQELIHLLG
jgi:hypothetical protein